MANVNEIWKDVVGYEGLYQVSNTGNVRSLDRLITTNRHSYTRKGKDCKLSLNSTTGYLTVGFTVDNKTITKKAHSLVALAFIPNPENKPCINHIDGNKLNNNDWNLEWCTYSENSKHAHSLGLNPSFMENRMSGAGEENPAAILTQIQVDEIRSKYIPYKYPSRKLAEEYGVSCSCITHILNNTSW